MRGLFSAHHFSRTIWRLSYLGITIIIVAWVAISLLISFHSLYAATLWPWHPPNDLMRATELSPEGVRTPFPFYNETLFITIAPPLSTSSTNTTTKTTTLPSLSSYVSLAIILEGKARKASINQAIKCLRSVLSQSTVPVNLIVICERKTFELLESAIKRNFTGDKARLRISYLNFEDVTYMAASLYNPVHGGPFSNSSAYPSVDLILGVIHQVLPFHHHIIYIDTEVLLQSDFKSIFGLFLNFTQKNLIGVTQRIAGKFAAHRQGDQSYDAVSDDGLPSAILFDLQKMRSSIDFGLFSNTLVPRIVENHSSGGVFYKKELSNLRLSFPELFYIYTTISASSLYEIDGPFVTLKLL